MRFAGKKVAGHSLQGATVHWRTTGMRRILQK
jgi:hypothetical protein